MGVLYYYIISLGRVFGLYGGPVLLYYFTRKGVWDHKTTFTQNIEVNQPNMEEEKIQKG